MVRRMVGNVHELRSRTGDTEKITINLGYVDLGHIDLMVQEGFYSNRTDFIRTAIRNQLERHADAVKRSVAIRVWTSACGTTAARISKRACSRRDAAHQCGGPCQDRPDVTPELAFATIGSVIVLGALHASPAVKAALADRIR